MLLLQILFWLLIFIVFYAYVGYGIVLFMLVKLKIIFKPTSSIVSPLDESLPEVTLLVAAYNEEDYIEEKIKNSLALHYPNQKLRFLFITDGSDDNTPNIVKRYETIHLMHEPARRGKIAAVERAMPFVQTEIIVFTDANTMLNPDAIYNMVRHYSD